MRLYRMAISLYACPSAAELLRICSKIATVFYGRRTGHGDISCTSCQQCSDLSRHINNYARPCHIPFQVPRTVSNPTVLLARVTMSLACSEPGQRHPCRSRRPEEGCGCFSSALAILRLSFPQRKR